MEAALRAKASFKAGLLLLMLSVHTAEANFFQDVWGVVTDPLKLQKSSSTLSDSVERSLIELKALEGTTNGHVQERLDQIRSIVNSAIGGTNDAIASAISQMNQLERQINDDAVNIIYRGQCVIEVGTMDQIQRMYADFIANLRESEPGISIFGIKIISISAKKVDVTDPDKAFFSLKEAVLKRLRSDIKDDTSAYDILSAYQNLARLARLTRCHYIDLPLAAVMTREVNDLNRLSLPWTQVVQIEH